MTVDQMSVGQVAVGKMTIGQMPKNLGRNGLRFFWLSFDW